MSEAIFRKGKQEGSWYSVFRVATPAARLSFSSINEPNNSYYEIKKAKEAQKGENDPLKLPAKKYRASLVIDNLDLLKEQTQYKIFMDRCEDLVKAAIPNVPREIIDFPIREVTPKDKTRDIYWAIEGKARADRKPRMWHAVHQEAIEKAGDHYLYDGCLAAIEGPLRISRFNYGKIEVYYVRIELETVYHVDVGEKFVGKPRLTKRDASDFGISSDAAAEQDFGEGAVNI